MGVETIIAGIGVAISAAGTVAGIAGQQAQASASKRAEDLRQQQMNLDAQRARRETIRKSLIATATAASTATAQGASDSSALGGAIGQISGQATRSISSTNQNQTIGAGIFQANRDMADGEAQSSFGNGLGSLGGMLINNASTFARII